MWLFQEPCDIQDKTDLFSFNSLCGAFNRPFLHVLPAFGRRTYDMWSCCSADQGRLSARSWGRREFGESSWSSLKLSWKIKQQTTEWNAPLAWVNSGVWSDTLGDESAQLNKRLNKGVTYYIFNFYLMFYCKTALRLEGKRRISKVFNCGNKLRREWMRVNLRATLH